MARILVVDDDRDILKIAERVLGGADHFVCIADDALKAMDLLNNSQFDLLISDANMPHYSGFELVRTLRNDDRHKSMAIAMLTGLRERKDVEKAVRAGVDDYIVKPLDPLLFLQKVEALFERKPPVNHPEIKFPESSPLSQAHVLLNVRLDAISELGAVVTTRQELRAGETLELQAHFFDELGIEAPPMKVLSVQTGSAPGEWKARLIFLGAQEALLQKIRKWIFTRASSARHAA